GGSGRGLSQCHGPLPRLGQLRRAARRVLRQVRHRDQQRHLHRRQQDLINAVKNRQGQETSLDYLDTGESFAVDADEEGLLAEYHPATADDLPDNMKSKDGTWYNHLGGTMAIGCDTEAVKKCPTSFEELLGSEYKGKVAMRGNPTTGEAGFMAVFAASLANGGSLDDIEPGI